jgi:hypothetical protein
VGYCQVVALAVVRPFRYAGLRCVEWWCFSRGIYIYLYLKHGVCVFVKYPGFKLGFEEQRDQVYIVIRFLVELYIMLLFASAENRVSMALILLPRSTLASGGLVKTQFPVVEKLQASTGVPDLTRSRLARRGLGARSTETTNRPRRRSWFATA